MSKVVEQPSRPFIPYSLCALLLVCLWLQVFIAKNIMLDTIMLHILGICVVGALGFWYVKHAHISFMTIGVVLLLFVIILIRSSFIYTSQMASVHLLESTAMHDFELVVSRDLVYKNHAWTGQANVIYQGRCIGSVGLRAKEQFLRETHLCCEGRFIQYKDKEFSEEQFKRGILGSIQVTKVNLKTYEEGIVGEVAQFRESCIFQLQPELSFGRALAACGLCAYRSSLYSFNIPRIFMRCGLMHLIAISSCHIVILSAYIDALFKKLTLKPLLRGVLNLFLLSSYALFCGVPASALRAILLVEQKYIMQCAGRKNHTLSAVSIVALLMLCVDPQLSVNIAFTLSLTCIFGMNIYGGLAQYYAKTAFHLSGYGAVQKVLRKPFASVRNTMCATTVAQLSCLPISCVYFGHFSLLAPISSALITSLFSLLSLFGIGVIVFSGFKPVQEIALFLVDSLGQLIETLASFISERSFASVSLIDISWIVSLAVFAAMVALYLFWPKGKRSVLVGICSMLVMLILGLSIYWRFFSPTRICVMDIGQGDAILLSDGAHSLLVDTSVGDVVNDALERQNISYLDAILLTHLDEDHAGGVRYMVGSVKAGRVLVGEGITKQEKPELQKAIQRISGSGSYEVLYGDEFDVGRFHVRVVWPHRGYKAKEANNASVELYVTYNDGQNTLTTLLTGDAERDQTKETVTSGDVGDIDFLKVGHHGAAKSLYPETARALKPEVAVASAGKNNRYGHPKQEAVDILEGVGARFYCTKDYGDVTVFPGEHGPRVSVQHAKVDTELEEEKDGGAG